jgi:Vitamin K-dependent gamma-carboxylase
MTKLLLNLWNRFWFSPIDPLPMAACRIGLGTLLVVWFIGLSPNWERFYAADGIISLSDNISPAPASDPWNVMLVTERWLPIRAYLWAGLAASILLAIGFWSRAASGLLFVLINVLVHRNYYIVNGEELVARMFLLYGTFSPWGQAWSVDAWLKSRRARRPGGRTLAALPWAWTLRMMQIQFLLIYTVSLGYKFAQDSSWADGNALHWTIASDRWWRMGEMSWLTLSCGGLLRKCMTYGTILIEGSAPILIWVPATRRYVVGAIIFLHTGIAIMIPGVGFFSLLMVAGAMLFIPAESFRRAARIARERFLSGSRVSAAPLLTPAGLIEQAKSPC